MKKNMMRLISWRQTQNLLKFGLRRLREGRLTQVAGSLTMTSVLAIVPIITVALAIFTAFPLFNTFRTSLEAYFVQNLMPKAFANTILGYLTQFATKATRLSAVSGVMLMFTAIATMAMIDKAFNQIWQVKRPRPFFQSLLVYWAIVTLGPLLIGASISVTSYLFTATSGVVGTLPFIGGVAYTAISILFTMGAYTLLYTTVPNRSVDWRDAAWGGFVASCAFEIAKRGFALFVTHFPTYTMVYGALAAIPIFLVWIYLSWMITLIGAVIAASLPVVRFERWWHVPAPGSEFDDAMQLLGLLVRAREQDQQAMMSLMQLRAATRFGLDEIENLLERMAEKKWVARVVPEVSAASAAAWLKLSEGPQEFWMLTRNPKELSMADVYRLFVYEPMHGSHFSAFIEQRIESGLLISLHDYFVKPQDSNEIHTNPQQ